MHMSSSADAIGSKTPQRLIGLRQAWVFAAAATIEIVVATFVSDTPVTNLAYWQDPLFYANAAAKIAIVAFCLLVIAVWPRREEIAALYRTSAAPGSTKYYLAANITLFVTLLAVRLAVSQMTELSVVWLAAYCFCLLATGASLAFLAVPPAFWWKLPKAAPAEIAIALAGGVFVLWLGYLAQQGWTTLSSGTLHLSHWFLTLYEPNVQLDTEKWLLGVSSFAVQIYGPCSGYEGVALIVTFLSVYMWVFRHELRFPNVLLILPLGMAAIWILNALRIAILVSIGAHLSPEVAIQGFHSQAGWISFLFVTLAAVALTRRVPFFAAASHSRRLPARPAATDKKTDLTIAYLAPFMAMVAANILASAFSPHDQWLYAVKVLAIGAALWWFRDVYMPLVRGVSWNSVAVGLAVGVAWIATDPGRDKAAPIGDWINELPVWVAAAWLTLRAFGSVILVPVAEELAFRGFLARWLISTRFASVRFDHFGLLAFAVSSLAFGVLHERWLAASLAGAAYALLMYRTNRLSDPIAAHAVSNLAIMSWALAAQQWSLL